MGMRFERLEYFEEGGKLRSRKIDEVVIPCDDVILAIGQDNAFPFIERDIGIDFDESGMPIVDRVTHQATRPGVFLGGDAAFGPENIIWAVRHGHEAAISIHQHCQGLDVRDRRAPELTLGSRKMGLHEWSYSNDFAGLGRQVVPQVDLGSRFEKLSLEVELGFTPEQARAEVERCLNCDVQTVFNAPLCIECDACVDICPVDCLMIAPDGDEDFLRQQLKVPAGNLEQALFVSPGLKHTGRVMLKDENVCVHCGLCAERCPTAAWDMQKSSILIPQAGDQLPAPTANRDKDHDAQWSTLEKAG